MQNFPEAGKTYQSSKFPGFVIQVTHIERQPDRFFILAIDKSSEVQNPLLVWQEEWENGKFKPVPDHP